MIRVKILSTFCSSKTSVGLRWLLAKTTCCNKPQLEIGIFMFCLLCQFGGGEFVDAWGVC